MNGSSAMTDHFILKAKIKLRLSVEWLRKAIFTKKFNTKGLKNQEIKRQYKNKLMVSNNKENKQRK